MCAYTSIFYKLYKHTHEVHLSVRLALERSRGNGHFSSHDTQRRRHRKLDKAFTHNASPETSVLKALTSRKMK